MSIGTGLADSASTTRSASRPDCSRSSTMSSRRTGQRKRRRKQQRSDYVGCSLVSRRGHLRLVWRDPADPKRRRTWDTGRADTPDERKRWDAVRPLVAALRDQGIDPVPHLQQYTPVQTDTAKSDTTPTVKSFFVEWIAS